MAGRDDCWPTVGQNSAGRLGDAIRAYVRSRWPNDTAKQAAQRYGLDAETGRNMAKGHVGVRAVERAIQADGYDALDALGEAITGLSRAEWELRKLQKMQGELHHATMEYDRLVARASALAAAADRGALRQGDERGPVGEAEGGGGA